ncbi:MAG: 50S ribosomal protein L20 [Pelagibacterales bacterium]|jgi:large subunit ribosomal protein L20|nr:50S ribosomal protein L20 [Pelagibacterales bacterium]
MPRSVNSVASRAKRKKILKQAKGYFGRRKNVWTVAKNAVEKGLVYAYRDRRNKKRNFRALWIVRINAACKEHGLSYSEFMHKAKKKNINLNRKVLADLAMNNQNAFEAIIKAVK